MPWPIGHQPSVSGWVVCSARMRRIPYNSPGSPASAYHSSFKWAYSKRSVPRVPLASTQKSQGRPAHVFAVSNTPSAPLANRSSADEASSTSTSPGAPFRVVVNVSDCALTEVISPTVHLARSMRCAPRSEIVLAPSRRAKRQSNGMSGSRNSSDSQAPRQRRI